MIKSQKQNIIIINMPIMIDIHTHILPEIDDGAVNLQEALKLTESLREQNITMAVCTPHFDPSKTSLQDFVLRRTTAINRMIDSKITLIAGSETMLHDYLFHYSDLSELCIENTRYLLLELPYTKKWDSKIYNKIRNLIIYYDILPIIAHIERYPAVIRSKKNIIKLIKTGCVIQANTDSIKGKKQKKQKKQLFRYIKKGYIDVLGSDCHNMAYRPPIISDAFEIIIQKFGDRFLDRLIYNADCIINGITLRQVIKNYEIP